MLIGTCNAQYIGKTMCGFENSHEYCIEINKDEYGYTVSGIINITDDISATSAYIPYASKTSLRRSWIIEE
jgi:hypothetical protein